MAAPNLPPGRDSTSPIPTSISTDKVKEFAELRATAPLWWNEQPADQGGFGDGGYWVVSKHRDVREVSLAQRHLLLGRKVDRPPVPRRIGAGTN